MEEVDRKRIQGNYVELVRSLQVRDIQDNLFQNGVLTGEDVESLSLVHITSEEGVRRLLKIIQTRAGSYNIFLQALLECGYEWLADKVRETDPETIHEAAGYGDVLDGPAKFALLYEQILKQEMRFQKQAKELEEMKERFEEGDSYRTNLEEKYNELKETVDSVVHSEKEVQEFIKDGGASNNLSVDVTDSDGITKRWFKEREFGRMPGEEDFTESVARTVGRDIAVFVAGGTSNPYVRKEPNLYATTMRRLVTELTNKHGPSFECLMEALSFNELNGFQTLAFLADEIFRHEEPKWGRIVVLYAFGGWMSKHCADHGMLKLADSVGDFVGHYVARKCGGWIDENGGWDGFKEFFKPVGSRDKTVLNSLFVTTVATMGILACVTLARR